MENNIIKWYEYYRGRKLSLSNFFLHYHYLVCVLLFKPRKVLEIGCGLAQHAILIKNLLPKTKVSVLDFSNDILLTIKSNYLSKFENFFNLNILDIDRIKTLPKFDLVISQGLMEHFNDSEIICIIDNFAHVADRMIFSVPSDIYENKDFGDEILRSKDEMRKLLKIIKYNYKVKNYLFDIGVRTKINIIKKNRYGLIKSLKLLLFKSCHLLVEIDYLAKNLQNL